MAACCTFEQAKEEKRHTTFVLVCRSAAAATAASAGFGLEPEPFQLQAETMLCLGHHLAAPVDHQSSFAELGHGVQTSAV
jgi:hypothetical protein